MYHEFPYTDFHEMNLDYLFMTLGKGLGLRLEVLGDNLRLVTEKGEVVSSVKISYADTAKYDVDGKPLQTYIADAGVAGRAVVFTKGDNTVTTITIPYADVAKKDLQDKDLLDYVYAVSIAGDKLRITDGKSSVYELTIPYAIKASTDTEGKDLTTYAATLETDGDELVLRDSKGRELSRIIVEYAEKASKDEDGNVFTETYASSLTTGTTTVKLIAKDGTKLSEITVPYATEALKDTAGRDFISDYAAALTIDGTRIALDAHDGSRLSTITVPFATLSDHAKAAIETVAIVGDQLVFTTYAGASFSMTAPYAVKAQKDDIGNTIKTTYISNATNDPETGELKFFNALGEVVATLVPTVTRATNDSYGNLIADYIKAIVADNQSDYITITHGTGDVDTIKINYAEHAYMDTNNNVIKNTYIKRLACEEDVEDGHWKLVAYNGDNPEAELFRIDIVAYSAQTDVNGRDITSYVGDIDLENSELIVKDGQNNTINTIDLSTLDFGKKLALNALELSLTKEDGTVLSTVTLPKSARPGYVAVYDFDLSNAEAAGYPTPTVYNADKLSVFGEYLFNSTYPYTTVAPKLYDISSGYPVEVASASMGQLAMEDNIVIALGIHWVVRTGSGYACLWSGTMTQKECLDRYGDVHTAGHKASGVKIEDDTHAYVIDVELKSGVTGSLRSIKFAPCGGGGSGSSKVILTYNSFMMPLFPDEAAAFVEATSNPGKMGDIYLKATHKQWSDLQGANMDSVCLPCVGMRENMFVFTAVLYNEYGDNYVAEVFLSVNGDSASIQRSDIRRLNM